MENYIGINIAGYQITTKIGMGGMAMVYRAHDTQLNRDVAIKFIRTDAIPPAAHEQMMRRFDREAKTQAQFNHKNIVSVFDYGNFHGIPFIVMAYLPGGTLKMRIGMPIPYQQALKWLLSIVDALAYAHLRGVIHRDIKPSNILFDGDDHPVLTDFGIAKILETSEMKLTNTGMGLGTPEYMAPEQWQGKVSPATDQYALGVVLHELLTGQKPYTADTPAGVAILQATEPLGNPRALVPDIPEGVVRLLYKVMARNPRDRYEDMDTLRSAIKVRLFPGDAKSEPILEVQPGREPKPQPGVSSETETVDQFESTPVEMRSNDAQNTTQSDVKKGDQRKEPFATWAKWAIISIMLVIGIVLGINLLKGGRTGQSLPESGPTQIMEAIVDISLPTGTATTLSAASGMTLPSPAVTETRIVENTATIEPTPELHPTMVNPVDDAILCYVPEGEFLLKKEDWANSKGETGIYSRNTHRNIYIEENVFLDAFWIYQTPVTNTQYVQCVQAGKCSEKYIAYGDYGESNHPVQFITWYQANRYCKWAGGRLPTEEEWLKAASGTDGRPYPWGDEQPSCEYGNFFYCTNYESVPVGSYPLGASPYGVLDMAGNGAEWVEDWYSLKEWEKELDDWVESLFDLNLKVTTSGFSDEKLSINYFNVPESPNEGEGFRCVVDVEN